jgi:hypothetical protein
MRGIACGGVRGELLHPNNINKELRMDESIYNAVKALWDGNAEYVIYGGTQYRVLTPNGKEDPVFVPTTDQSLYGSLSTGFPQTHDKKKRPGSG